MPLYLSSYLEAVVLFTSHTLRHISVQSTSMFAANPIYDTPILGMTTRPRVAAAVEYGNATSFWVEYPSGLIDLSRLAHLDKGPLKVVQDENVADMQVRQMQPSTQLDVQVDGDRVVRIAKNRSAIIIIDMQKYVHALCRKRCTIFL